jgi:hypothetical protein
MKKLLLIAVVAIGFLVAAAPQSEARVFVNVGFGFPFGFCGYPAYPYYPYYPYAYAPGPVFGTAFFGGFGPRRVVVVRRPVIVRRHW